MRKKQFIKWASKELIEKLDETSLIILQMERTRTLAQRFPLGIKELTINYQNETGQQSPHINDVQRTRRNIIRQMKRELKRE